MPAEIDVYREWLRIDEPARPLSHYQLLRLSKFEDDPVKVRSHYRKMNAHVRKFASGDYAAESQALLNELAKAMLCLTDTRRKGDYDASLGREGDGGAKKRTLEQILLARKVIETAQLEKARNYASAVGLEVRDALVQQKMAKSEIVMQVYAESIGLPYVDLAEMTIDPELVAKIPAVTARHHSCVPVIVDEGQLLMASPNPLAPDVEDDLRLRIGMPVRSVLCTATGVNDAINQHFPKEAAASQIAAGTAAPAAAAEEPKDNKTKSTPVDPETVAERQRKQLMYTGIAGSWTVIGTMVVVSMTTNLRGFQYAMAVAAAMGLGAAIAGTVYVVTGKPRS